MPNRISPIPQFHSQPRPGPSLALRPRRWRRDRLDGELASGADPASSPELTWRAAQLQSQAVRTRLADALVAMLARAHEPNLRRFRVAGRQQNVEIREYADNLRALVARLRDDRPIDIQGAAMTARLVDDRSSPSTARAMRAWGARCSQPASRSNAPRGSGGTGRARREHPGPIYRGRRLPTPGPLRLRRLRGRQGGDPAGG